MFEVLKELFFIMLTYGEYLIILFMLSEVMNGYTRKDTLFKTSILLLPVVVLLYGANHIDGMNRWFQEVAYTSNHILLLYICGYYLGIPAIKGYSMFWISYIVAIPVELLGYMSARSWMIMSDELSLLLVAIILYSIYVSTWLGFKKAKLLGLKKFLKGLFDRYYGMGLILPVMFLGIRWYSVTLVSMGKDDFALLGFPIMILAILIFLVGLIMRQNKLTSHLEMQADYLENYTATMEALYGDIRAYKHDMSNVLLSMRHYMDTEDKEGLKTFFYEHIDGMKGFDLDIYHLIAQLTSLKLDELKGLFLSKYQLAKNKGIYMEVGITESLDTLNIASIDLCRMMGILLDNAIEASGETDNKHLHVHFEKKENKWVITIENSYRETSRLLNKRGMWQSTKGPGRGIGLTSLKQLVNSYKHVTLETELEKEIVRQCLVVEV
jgi:sensor histidine kinase YesM